MAIPKRKSVGGSSRSSPKKSKRKSSSKSSSSSGVIDEIAAPENLFAELVVSPKRKEMGDGSSGSRSKKSKRNSSSKSSSSSSFGVIDKTATPENMFAELANEEDPTVMEMDGIATLCDKLDLDPETDIRVLVLLWKLGSKEKPAQITRDEFISGCDELKVDSFEKLKTLLPALDTGFLDRDEFKSFYKFCFQFNREGTHRTIDKDTVVALWGMVLKGRIADERLETFCSFTESQKSYSRITLDQWTSFLVFCYEYEDVSTYDKSNSAWPVLIDEYVEYMEEEHKIMR